MDEETRTLVRTRAADRCEYCRLRQEHSPWKHQIEHVTARQHGGTDHADNLAWSCVRCNLSKGPNLAGRTPESGELVPLYNPRTDKWDEHFKFDGPLIVGITPTGQVTVAVLKVKEARRVQLREMLIAAGELD